MAIPQYFLPTASGQFVPLELGNELGAGAAGKVFALAKPQHKQLAAKIYSRTSDCNVSRLAAMIGSPPNSVRDSTSGLAQFAWPSEIIYERTTSQYRAIGFTMPKIDMQHSVSLEYYFDSTLWDYLSPDDRSLSSKLAIAHNLAALTADLHDKDSCFIDFKPQNMRVTKRNRLVSFLDCDGYRVTAKDGTVFGATHFSTGYIAPEVLQANQGPGNLSFDQDRFALAVVLFQLLNFGIHPFQGIPNANVDAQSDDDKVKARLYPYGAIPNRMMAPKKSSVHGLLPVRLRQLFDQAFLGRDRPSAKQWQEALYLLQGGNGTFQCQLHPSNPEHGGFIGSNCLVCFRNKIIQTSPPPRPVVIQNPHRDARATVTTQKNWATQRTPSAPNSTNSLTTFFKWAVLAVKTVVGIFVGMALLGIIISSCNPNHVASSPTPTQIPAARPTPPASAKPVERPVPVSPSPDRRANPATPSKEPISDPDAARLKEVVLQLEIQYPQLNPRSGAFQEGYVAEVVKRTRYYIDRGMPASYAVEAAAAEIFRNQNPSTKSAIKPKELISRDQTAAPPSKPATVVSNCEANAVSKDGKALLGAAKVASIKKCLGTRQLAQPTMSHNAAKALAPTVSNSTIPNEVKKPENSHWDYIYSRRTDVWSCNIGFSKVGDSCEPYGGLPPNAYFVQNGNGRWSCVVGYALTNGTCTSVGTQ